MTNSRESLASLLGQSAPHIRIVDIGALWLGEGGQPYRPLLETGLASVVGFEAIPEECAALNQRFESQGHVYLPYALGDGKRHPFHRCNFAMTSSLLEPDVDWMGQFTNLQDICQVTSVQEIETHRLDDVAEILGVDYLKVDVQGAELTVLNGATRNLRDALVVQTEVEFVPIYRDQPLFADIDRFLREQGFMFHRFVATEGRPLEPWGTSSAAFAQWGQVLWSDAVYIRPILTWHNLPTDSLLKLAVILDAMYQSFDFSAKLLKCHDSRTGSDYCSRYVEMIERRFQSTTEKG